MGTSSFNINGSSKVSVKNFSKCCFSLHVCRFIVCVTLFIYQRYDIPPLHSIRQSYLKNAMLMWCPTLSPLNIPKSVWYHDKSWVETVRQSDTFFSCSQLSVIGAFCAFKNQYEMQKPTEIFLYNVEIALLSFS